MPKILQMPLRETQEAGKFRSTDRRVDLFHFLDEIEEDSIGKITRWLELAVKAVRETAHGRVGSKSG